MANNDSEITRIPADWCMKRIGDFAAVKGGKRLPAGAILTKQPTKHPYIRIVDFRDGRIDPSNLMYVPEDVFPAIARYTISSQRYLDLYSWDYRTCGSY